MATRREIEDRFINEWGLLANAWGVSPLLGRIHGLLLLQGEPMTAEAVCERLEISRASASVQLNAILAWGLARRMYLPGDRRQHYLAEPEPWTWFRRAVRVRKEREFDPVITGLDRAAEDVRIAVRAEGGGSLQAEADRLKYLMRFVHLFFDGIETFLQIDPPTLQAFLHLADEAE
jgi:DNA-binding transcriptional regulator GbsR (MarR family)